MAHSIEYDILYDKIEVESAKLNILKKTFQLSPTSVRLIFLFISFVYVCRKTKKFAEEISKHCAICTDPTCKYKFKDSLQKTTDLIHEVIMRESEVGMPKIFIKIHSYYLGEIENILENFWIAADPDIKDLAQKLSGKLKNPSCHSLN